MLRRSYTYAFLEELLSDLKDMRSIWEPKGFVFQYIMSVQEPFLDKDKVVRASAMSLEVFVLEKES